MDIRKVLGTNLRKYRIEKGFSQEKFAEICELHRTYKNPFHYTQDLLTS